MTNKASDVKVRRPLRNEILVVASDGAGGAVLFPKQHISMQTSVLLEVGDRVDLNHVPDKIANEFGLRSSQRGVVGAAGRIDFPGLPENPKVLLNDLINHELPVTLTVSHLSNLTK